MSTSFRFFIHSHPFKSPSLPILQLWHTSSFCHTFLYLQFLDFPFCFANKVCDCLVQQTTCFHTGRARSSVPTGWDPLPTCGYDGNVMSAATCVLVQNLCRTSDLWATSRRLLFLAGVFMQQPSERGFVDSSSQEERWPWIVRNLD